MGLLDVRVLVRLILLYFSGILLGLVIPALPFLNKQEPAVLVVVFALYGMLVLSLVFLGVFSTRTQVLLVLYLAACAAGRMHANQSLHLSEATLGAASASPGCALITGSTRGNGLHAAELLLRLGWRVVIHGRSGLQEARQTLLERVPGTDASMVVALEGGDLSSLSSVRHYAARVARRMGTVELLINNAGVNDLGGALSPSGVDAVLHVNYLGGAFLAHQMIGSAGTTRVVHMSSLSHTYAASLDAASLLEWRRVMPDLMRNYGRSKLLQILWTALSPGEYPGVLFTSLHPGRCYSGTAAKAFQGLGERFFIPRFLSDAYIARMWQWAARVSWNPPEYCARAEVAAAFQDQDTNGQFLMQFTPVPLPPAAQDEALLARLKQQTLAAFEEQQQQPEMKKRRVFVVPRWGCVDAAETDYYSWLRAELQPLASLVYVEPSLDPPVLSEALQFLDNSLKGFTSDDVLLGHSVGNQLLLRWLARADVDVRDVKILCVAGWFEVDKGKEWDTLIPFLEPFDTKAAASKISKLSLLVSDNDQFTSDYNSTIRRFESAFGKDKVKHRVVSGAQHFNGAEEPSVLEELKAMIQESK